MAIDRDRSLGLLVRTSVAAARARMHSLRYGFLFIPTVVAFIVASAAPALVAVDRARGADVLGIGFRGEADAARAILATIAGSLITVAGLTFSITIVTLQLVSQQFSPRALRGFLGNRFNQVVVGAFVGTFIYCVLVLRNVSQGESGEEPFVPSLSVTASVVLAVASIVLLLVFIHEMSRTIQVSTIAAGIAETTLGALEPLYADTFGEPSAEDPDALVRDWSSKAPKHSVRPRRAGYLQSVKFERIDEVVGARDVRARLLSAPGDFVTPGAPLLEYWAQERDTGFEQAVLRAISIQNERDHHQDAEFGLRQLVDIGLKAISPGVNDPTTAVTCIGYIGAILERLAALATPLPVRRYRKVDAVVVARARDFREYVETAFVELGRYSDKDARVAGALLKAIAGVTKAALRGADPGRADILAGAATDIAERARARAETTADVEMLDRLIAVIDAERRSGANTPIASCRGEQPQANVKEA
jgi:uncharacterized membrane protein